MKKKLGVVTGSAAELEKLQREAAQHGLTVVAIEPGTAPPPATAALVVQNDGSGEALKSAALLGEHQENLLALLAEAIDCRESFSPGSSERVRQHALRFAEALDLNEEDTLLLERAALVRDIGKLRVPNHILLKNGPLTYDEWTLLQSHTALGADLVRQAPALADTEEIVRCHHESWDGDGYPRKLEGDHIPLLAQAMKILDVYCAMTSPRHYRAGQSSHEQALEHLRIERGKHFNPRLVDVFIDKGVGRPPETRG